MSTCSTPSFARAVAASTLVLVLGAAALHAEDRPRVLRVLDPDLAITLDNIYRVSPSAQALIDRLERSDLLIHVVAMRPDRIRAFTGTTHFVVRAGTRRFLRITIDERLAADRRAAALGHELQHAVEVADAASVVDHASFAALYRDIGHPSGGDPHANCFETFEAIRVGARVLGEFRVAASSARREARAAASPGGGR